MLVWRFSDFRLRFMAMAMAMPMPMAIALSVEEVIIGVVHSLHFFRTVPYRTGTG